MLGAPQSYYCRPRLLQPKTHHYPQATVQGQVKSSMHEHRLNKLYVQTRDWIKFRRRRGPHRQCTSNSRELPQACDTLGAILLPNAHSLCGFVRKLDAVLHLPSAHIYSMQLKSRTGSRGLLVDAEAYCRLWPSALWHFLPNSPLALCKEFHVYPCLPHPSCEVRSRPVWVGPWGFADVGAQGLKLM